jgi:hypothetical protein
MRIGLFLLFILTSLASFSQAIVEDELRKSIYFGGGSYYIDDEQITELFHWLDSIPKLT